RHTSFSRDWSSDVCSSDLAVQRVEAGESKELIDAAAVAFGMPMGPIELMDTVGLDVGKSVAEELGSPVPENSRFARLIAEKKFRSEEPSCREISKRLGDDD